MAEYRYHRMANNSAFWREPTSGRLGTSTDYVGKCGFGHEDWNFAKDVWQDGLYHLFLRGTLAYADRRERFNIALGALTRLGHVVVGFCNNAKYEPSVLDPEIWQKRAMQLDRLETIGGLGGELVGLTVEEKAEALKSGPELYNVAVAPKDLIVLDTPIQVPPDIINPRYHRYQFRRLDESQYTRLTSLATEDIFLTDEDDESFPEGKLVASIHRRRERDAKKVSMAKANFKDKHGSLYCEACGWCPEVQFPGSDLKNTIIEAHHDIPLSDPEHGGTTHAKDLRMLCPNCHRAIHRLRPWRLVSEFKSEFFGT